MRSRGWTRAAGLLLGALLDAVLRDPRRGHPVAGFGAVAAGLERRWYADSRGRGAVHAAVLVGGAVALGAAVERLGRRHPSARLLGTAVAGWAVLGGASLAGHGRALAGELHSGDVVAARARMPSLCGRDPALLDGAGMARAGVESLAENTSDAVVGALLWGAVGGVPGLLGYRAANTLDAMVGYRSPRYRRFGWAAARLDDLANLLPARVCALLCAGLAPAVDGSRSRALLAWRRDAAAHPSPNAGPVEATVAGALGVTLGGPTAYRHGIEQRPRLGDGPPPGPADLRRAARLSRLVGAAAVVLAAGLAVAVDRSGGHQQVARSSELGRVAQCRFRCRPARDRQRGGGAAPSPGSSPARARRTAERVAARLPPARCSSSSRTK